MRELIPSNPGQLVPRTGLMSRARVRSLIVAIAALHNFGAHAQQIDRQASWPRPDCPPRCVHTQAGPRTGANTPAESEGAGVGSVNAATRKNESEGGGVGSVNAATRKNESEGGGVGPTNSTMRKGE